MTTAGGDGERSRFRCLDAARYVVAAAVTVLIMAVIVNAVKVVLRPEPLQLSVVGGSISAKPPAPEEKPAQLSIELNLRAENPSGRARMYYVSIDAYLFDNNKTAASSSTPEDDSIFFFHPSNITVVQQERVDTSVVLHLNKTTQVEAAYFDMLSNGSRISDATLRLDGDLITEVNSHHNETRSRTSYYCQQLLVSGDSDDLNNRQDVICKQQGR